MMHTIKILFYRNLIFIILIFAFVIRFINISQIPIGVNNDELDFIINAKLFFLTGQGIVNYHPSINLTNNFPNAEFTSVMMAPFVGPFELSLFWSRLPYVLIGTLTGYLLYLIVKKIIGKEIALFVALAAAINPWNLFFSRIIFDAPVTLFFLLLGFNLLLSKNKWRILASVIPFWFAFHSYMGMMIIFPFFVTSALIFAYKQQTKSSLKINYLLVGILCALFMVRYLIILPQTPIGSRTGELINYSDPEISNLTNINRRLAIDNPFSQLFTNKLVTFSKIQLSKYLGALNPALLFTYGDTRSIFSFGEHGLFYYIDGLFILLGICCIFKKNIRTFWLLLFWLVISPLPSTISREGITYASRSYLLQPVLLIYIGTGIYFLVNYFQNKMMRNIIIIILVTGYGISLANFLYYLHLKSPVSNSEGYNFSARVMVNYAKLVLNNNQKIMVVAPDPKTQYKQYVFYTARLNKNNVNNYLNDFKEEQFSIGNYQVVKCPDTEELLQKNITFIVEKQSTCPNIDPKTNHLSIAKLADAGSIYDIYNDNLCSNFMLTRYPQNIKFTDLNVEKLSAKIFCEKFISKY